MQIEDGEASLLTQPGKVIPARRSSHRKKPRTIGKKPAEPERKCIVSGLSGPKDRLIRFVVGPDDEIVPDLSGKLPGRGIWISADRAMVEDAVTRRLFARAARCRVEVPFDLVDRLTSLLVQRALRQIGLVRKAGYALNGFEKVRDCIEKGRALVLVEASDGAADGRDRLLKLAKRQTMPAMDRFMLLDCWIQRN